MKLSNNKLKKIIFGFTLAEVLITLGIIGVVAALTIPSLFNKWQDGQFKSGYKRAFSAAQQALSSANSQGLMSEVTAPGDSTNVTANWYVFANQFKVGKKCFSGNNSSCWDSTGEKFGLSWSAGAPAESTPAFLDSSGMAYSMYWSGESLFFVDTNGFDKPNQWGKDRFVLDMANEKRQPDSGLPTIIAPHPDNEGAICTQNKCETSKDYFGTSWLYN